MLIFFQDIWYCNLKNTHNTEYFPIFHFFFTVIESRDNDIVAIRCMIKHTIYRIKRYYTGGGLNKAH